MTDIHSTPPSDAEDRRSPLLRAAVVVLIVVAAFAIGTVLLGGSDTTTYKVRFQNAGQLVKGDDVQVGGRRIGSVEKISLGSDNLATIRITVANEFAPLHEGTSATIRATSLSGIANRYIALDPAPQSARALPDGATLGTQRTQAPVDLDQVIDTFDDATRHSLQQLVKGSATQYDGVGVQANRGARYFNPAISTTSRLVNELVRDQTAFNDLITSSSRVVTVLAGRRDELTSLVSNTNQTAGAIAAENQSLSQALGVLPSTLRRANTTFVNLRATLGDLDTLVAASKPATKDLARFLRKLRPLVANARPTVADLRRLVKKSGRGNDLTDLLNKAPGLERVAKPAFAHSVTALRKSTPVLSFVRPYTPDLVGWFRDFGVTTADYDANGHFARIQPIFNLFSLTANTGTLNPGNRLQGFTFGQLRRCPGTASQVPEDGSAPFRDTDGKLDCDPRQTLEGP